MINLAKDKIAFSFLLFIFLCIATCCNANDFLGFTNPLVQAADNDDFERVKTLLQRGVNSNIRGRFGVTALMRASFNGNEDMVKLLLEYGANPILQDVGGVDSAQMARRSNYFEIIELFNLKHNLLTYDDNISHSKNISHQEILAVSDINNAALSNSNTNKIDTSYIDESIENKKENSQYISQLYEDFYSLDYTANSKSHKYLNSGVYKVAVASNTSNIVAKSDTNFIKLTEAIEITDIGGINLQSKRNYVITGFIDSAEMNNKINSKLINFYFKSEDFNKDYDQLIVQLSNNFSAHQSKKACARFMRRFHTLRCEIY